MREIKFRALREGRVYEVATRKPDRADWKGWYKMHGYVMRLVTEHPFANSRGYVAEHRLVYEEYLSDFLPKNAVIHHINRQRDDNDLNNLEYMPEQARHAKHHDGGVRNSNGQFVATDPAFSSKKYRLLNKNTGRMQVFTLAKLIATTFRSSQFEYRGEFTGLLDNNGVEIYEGDIFIVKSLHDGDEGVWNQDRHNNGGDGAIPQVVVWSERHFGFEFGDSTRIKYEPYDFEVIGNIWEHSHLLGEEDAKGN